MACDYIFKFITLGDSGVGKSSLAYRFTDKEHSNQEPTIGAGFGHRTITINRKKIKLYIWDTAGQEKFRSMTRSYFRQTAGALLLYDITNRESFTNVASWLHDLRQEVAPEVVIMLVGHKSDLQGRRAVSTEEGSQFAKDHGLLFKECSAKTAENVEEAFLVTASAVQDSFQLVECDEEALKRRGIRFVGRRGGSGIINQTLSMVTGRSSCCSYS